MKTPRLVLLALLALAPAAYAALPAWTIVEEGSRAWPTVRFSVGSDPRSLNCRYTECNPATNKGQSNLYLLTKTGASTPTKVTTYRPVPRSKWNPRYYTDGPEEMVPEIINARAQPYEAELSHFKLDNTGGKLFVVQGTARYPATTDIEERQFNSYDQMKVAPPKKLMDDEIKPGAPAPKNTWWCNHNTGDVVGVQPGQKAPAGYTRLASRSSTCGKQPVASRPKPRTLVKLPSAGKWKDSITPVGEWRAIVTSKLPVLSVPIPVPAMTFYCYHEKMDGDKDLLTHLKKNPLIVECVNWGVPADDATKEETGKKYKVRNNYTQFDLAYMNGKLTTMSVVPGVIVTEKAALPDSLGGEKFVKVTGAQSPDAQGTIPLSAQELTWLDKSQANLYTTKKPAEPAALKAHVDSYRKNIVENLDPNATAIGKYQAAAADPKATGPAIDAALPPEVWGGKDNKTIVELFGDREDIQLSKADFDALSKLPSAEPKGVTPLQTYTNDRAFASGRGKAGSEYNKELYDPIVLHRTAMAARKALGKTGTTPVVTKPGDGDALVAPLTDAEMKLLTPAERQAYEKLLENVKNKVPGAEQSLSKESDRLRKLIAAERRGESPAYVPPKDLEAFKKMPPWHKDIFCDPKKAASMVTAAGPTTTDVPLNKGGAAVGNLEDVDAKLKAEKAAADQKSAAQASATLPDWAKGPCAEYLASKTPPTTGGGNVNNGGSGIGANLKRGDDAEIKAKEKSKWINQDLLVPAAKGAMVGLLLGSLFGPVGLIAGPLIGAALFYGLTKLQE